MTPPKIVTASEMVATFAIGDVHGRADLLGPLLQEIAAIAAAEGIHYRVVFLGDIIDRGPDSHAALTMVKQTLERVPGSVLLVGNHEEFMLDVLSGGNVATTYADWLNNGGTKALMSFGIDPRQRRADVIEQLGQHADIIAMLRDASDAVVTENHVFVHAGVVPGRPLSAQSTHDLRWIRDAFLESEHDHGKIVVHGHTPTTMGMPELHQNRIALDTGAFFTGFLTALRVDAANPEPTFLGASIEDGIVVVRQADAMDARRFRPVSA